MGYDREWYLRNRERRIKQMRANRILKAYGLTVDQYEGLLISPCNICGDSSAPRHLDHDHETGIVRGALCQNCNTGIGKLGDNIAGVTRALHYLTQHEERTK